MSLLSKIAILLVITLLGACSQYPAHSTPSPSPTPVRVIDTTCTDLVAQAFQSTTPVVGGFECLSASLQFIFISQFGIGDDQSMADWVATYPPHTYDKCNDATPYDQKHNFVDYLNHDVGNEELMVRYYFRQSDGRVDYIDTAGTGAADNVHTLIPPTCKSVINWPKPKKFLE